MKDETASVRDFYDSFGWRRDRAGTYNDTASFVDLRPVLSAYYHRTLLRVRTLFKPCGTYFLDAGSGPVSQPESLMYSAGYTYRVCLDVSARALQDAQRTLGRRGLFVMGDLAHLPFRGNVFDAEFASHVLYHVPEDEQAGAVHELYRTLKRGGTCVVIYMWPSSFVTRVGEEAARLRAAFAALLRRMYPAGPQDPPCKHPPTTNHLPHLYWRPQTRASMKVTLAGYPQTEVRVWRSVDGAFTRAFIGDNWVGTLLLRIMYRVEQAWPHAMGRLGRYVTIVLRKPAG